MANLGIMNGAIFYKYDIHVFDNVLLGFLILKPSQIDDITSKGYKLTSTSFYGITRSELVKQFISFLKKYDIEANKDDFLEGTITDKRVDKTKPYIHDALILHEVSHKNIENNVKKPIQVKEDIIFKVDYSNKLYKVVLDLEGYGIGQGKKTLYDYNKDMLKDKIEAYFKAFKKNINAIIDANTIKDVGKVLINTVVYKDKVIGSVDLSTQGLPNIEVTATSKQELLDNIIKQLKGANLTGKLNWGSVVDKTKEDNKMAKNTTTLAALKSLQKKLVQHINKIGLDENEIDSIVKSMIPNIEDMGVGTLGGTKVNLSYVLPWNLDKTFIKKKKFATDIAETHPDNVVIKEVGLSLYILDSSDEELEVSIMVDVKWINTFFGQLREDSYTIIEDVVKINQGGSAMGDNVEAQPIKTNMVMQEFLDKIVKRPEVKLTVKIDKYTPYPVSFAVNYPGYKDFVVSFEDNATKFRAQFLIDAPFMELQAKTMAMFDYLKQNNFNVSQEGIGIVVRGQYGENSVDIINDIAKLLVAVKNYQVKANPQDLGTVKPNVPKEEPKPAIKEYVVEKGDKIFDKVPFVKGQIYEVDKVIKAIVVGEDDTIETLQFEVLSVFKNGKIRCKNTKLGYEFKITNDPASTRKVYRLIKDVDKVAGGSAKEELPKETPKPAKEDLPKETSKPAKQKEVAPPVQDDPANREVERTFKKSKVKDPEHVAQLERMKAYIKKIADVVDADNDFALRFLEEPKEFQKYKLPTVGVGLFYYGDKSIAELEQNPLYKKVYRGRGLSILRKFFKTTDLNGEPCLLVLFVDNDYAKQSKAKLIKEALENNTTIKINGRDYKVKAILEKQCVVESVAGDLYIDIYSDLKDLI